jgi:predicted nucleic acid-binding protein
MVIVDSSVWVDYLNNKLNSHTAWLESALGTREVGLTSLILCEVLQGIRHERQFLETREQLMTFPVFEGLGAGLAVASAQNFRVLQRRGVTVRKSIDCLIATYCIATGHDLLHRDRDFDAFQRHLGLSVVDPDAVHAN